MKLCEKPLVEIKGLHVFVNNKPLKTKTYRLSYLNHLFREPMRSERVAFTLTELGFRDGYTYYILAITPSKQNEFHRFAMYCGEGKVQNLWGSYIIESFKELNNGATDVLLNHGKIGATYNIDGCFSIFNTDIVNNYWLLKLKGPFKEAEIFRQQRGEPIIFKRNEKIRNYNYLIWRQRELPIEEKPLLQEVKEIIKRRY